MTHALQLTPPAPGAIAVILLAGPEAPAILTQLTAPKAVNLAANHLTHTTLHHPTTRDSLDDALIITLAPDRFELHLHGGLAITSAILEALQTAGATLLTPNHAASALPGPPLHTDLALTLPRAHTPTALHLLTAQTTHGLTAWTRHWLTWLDSPPRSPTSLWPLHSAIQWLLTRSATLSHLLTPPRIAILGPPNAGKSTLANALLGRPSSITSDLPGTTRDWVDAPAIFTSAEISVRITLIDTAGIRPTRDPLEQESIARTHQQAAAADLIILLFDATQRPTPDAQALANSCRALAPTLITLNKTDLIQCPSTIGHWSLVIGNFPLPISAQAHTNLDQLMHAALTRLDLAAIDPREPFAFSDRQRTLLTTLATCSDPATLRTGLASLLD